MLSEQTVKSKSPESKIANMGAMQSSAKAHGAAPSRDLSRDLRSLGPSLWLVSTDDREGGEPHNRSPAPIPTEREDLPYKVEIWNEAGAAVEQIVAVTANASIGYAAYYAATREFPDRHITLRHRNAVVARWSGPKH
ncbi:MAG TPA: hypothetical protein VKW08_22315 [Xanthobacteraceae bacterium]|jgi:hypothetical protein|nr:hypothetical protein [Xanthobacteraceae bacterium]